MIGWIYPVLIASAIFSAWRLGMEMTAMAVGVKVVRPLMEELENVHKSGLPFDEYDKTINNMVRNSMWWWVSLIISILAAVVGRTCGYF